MNKTNLLSQVLITEANLQEDTQFSEKILSEALNVSEAQFSEPQDGADLIVSLMEQGLL